MAVTVERLIATLEARFDKYEKALDRALGQTNRSFTAIERRGQQMERRMAQIGSSIGSGAVGIGKRWVAGIVAGIGINEIRQLSDAATRIDNALKVAGLSGDQLEQVYGRLRDSAMANAAPIETLVGLYAKLALTQKELGVSSEELLSFTNNVALALRVSGTDAQAASGALLQLSQALGGGVVRAEEFNSVLEGAPTIAQAVASGLKEAGGSVAQLRKLVVDGKVSSEAFFRAFEAGAPLLEERVANATFTTEQAFNNLKSALVDTAREFNNSTGAGAKFASGVNNAARAIGDFDVAGFIQKLKQSGAAIDEFLESWGILAGTAPSLADAPAIVLKIETQDAESKAETLKGEIARLQERIALNTELGFDNVGALARLREVSAELAAVQSQMTTLQQKQGSLGASRGYQVGTPGDPNAVAAAWGKTQKPNTPIKEISIDDYAAPKASKGSKGAKERADDYERLTKRISEATAAGMAEIEAQRQLNPLIDDYGYAVEKARMEQELLSAAKEAGKKITPELRAEIEQLSNAYAATAAEANRLAEEQDKIREAAEFSADLMKGALSELRSALADGKLEFRELGDIAINVLDKIISKIEDDLVDALFSINSGGNWLSKLFGFFFGGSSSGGISLHNLPGNASGTNNWRGGLTRVNERGGEVMNLPRGTQIIPHDVSVKALRAANGSSPISVDARTTIDARGADQAAFARFEAAQRKRDAEFPARVVATIRAAQKGRVL